MAAYQTDSDTGGRSVGRLERLMYRHERWMYRRSRPNQLARGLNRLWAWIGSVGIGGSRLVTLEVVGRRSGKVNSVPLIVADAGGERYLVAMLGERADWVTNVRAAGGSAVLRRGESEPVQLEEVDPADRSEIVQRHLEVAPAARSFLPDRATVTSADFDDAVREIPVFRIRTRAPAPQAQPVRRFRRPRRRWVVAISVAAVASIVAAVILFGTQSGPAPLALPTTIAAPATGSIDGRWSVASGSVAGFRIGQVFLGLHADVVGRTTEVSGSADVRGDQLLAATFSVDLAAITVNGKVPPQLAISLDTSDHPVATVSLSQPITIPSGFVAGEVAAITAPGTLTMNGVTKPVQVDVSLRRDGHMVEAAGAIPVAFADWNIVGPTGYGLLGSLEDHGSAEFLLVLRPAA